MLARLSAWNLCVGIPAGYCKFVTSALEQFFKMMKV